MKLFKIIILISQLKLLFSIKMTRHNFICSTNGYITNNILNSLYYNDDTEKIPETNAESKTETVEFSLEKDNQNPLTINFMVKCPESVWFLYVKKMDIKAKELEIQYNYRFY